MERMYLFRLRIVPKDSKPILFQFDRGTLLGKIISAHPGAFVRVNVEWIIANSRYVDETAVFFKFGRVSKKVRERFDKEKRMFELVDDDLANSTVCVYDEKLQVLAIEKRSGAPSPLILARYIAAIVNGVGEGESRGVLSSDGLAFLALNNCEVKSIDDPFDFINYITHSHKVVEFSVTFGKGNPFDYDELLQRPMQNLVEYTEGVLGRVSVKNSEGLKGGNLVGIAHAVAAHGTDASARIQATPDSSFERVYLKTKESIAHVDFDMIDENSDENINSVVRALRDKYHSVRG